MAEIKVDDSTIGELFGLIRGLTVDVNTVGKQVTTLLIRGEEKDKRCVDHNNTTGDHDKRIYDLEIWRAGQQGVAGLIQRWGPVAITAAVALYVASLKRG